MTIIRDPRTGLGQGITEDFQALVQSETHTEARHHSGKGEAFILKSGYITTSAVADAFVSIFYFKNTDNTKPCHVGYFRTCNTIDAKWNFIKNPTSISNSTDVTPQNLNFSSNIPLIGTAEFGSATSTTTGGTEAGTWIQPGPGHSDPDFGGALILGPNDSFALEMAPVSTGAGEVCVTIVVWQTAE